MLAGLKQDQSTFCLLKLRNRSARLPNLKWYDEDKRAKGMGADWRMIFGNQQVMRIPFSILFI